MKFTMTIVCDNAAFGDETDDEQGYTRAVEIERILSSAVAGIHRHGLHTGTVYVLHDINGNNVGQFELEE